MTAPMNPDRSGRIRLTAAPNPFEGAHADVQVEAGQTIAEILEAQGLPVPAFDEEGNEVWGPVSARVLLGDQVIPPRSWRRIRPGPDNHLLVRTIPGEGKSPERIALQIAVLAAAAYTGSLASWLVGGGAIGSAAYAAASGATYPRSSPIVIAAEEPML